MKIKNLSIIVLAMSFALLFTACKNSNERTISATEYDSLLDKLENIESELQSIKVADLDNKNRGEANYINDEDAAAKKVDGDADKNVDGDADKNVDEEVDINVDGDAADESIQEMMPYEHAYIQKSIYLTNQMIIAAKDVDFIQIFTSDPDMIEYLKQYGTINESMLKRAIFLEFSNSTLDAAIVKAAEGEYKFSEDLLDRLRGRMLPILANMLNAENGSLSVASLSTIQQGDAFIKPENFDADGNILVILLYDSNTPDANKTNISFVAFRDSKESTIIGSACFVDDPDNTLSNDLYGNKDNILNMFDKFSAVAISKNNIVCAVYEGEQLASICASGDGTFL